MLLHATKAHAEADGIVRCVVEEWVQATRRHRYLLEYVLSALDQRPSTFLGKWLLGHFPSNAGAFLTRTWQPLLDELSDDLCTLTDGDTDAESLDDLRQRADHIKAASPVLEVLSITTFPESGPAPYTRGYSNSPEDMLLEVAGDDDDDDDDNKSLGVNVVPKPKSQRENKQKRGKRPHQKAIDQGPNLTASELAAFRELGVSVPQNRKEADALSRGVLEELKQSLTWYLEIVRFPQTRDALLGAINEALLNPHQPESTANTDARMVPSEFTRTDIANKPETPVPYPMMQPMKAALYLDSVKVFGEWRILVSSGAVKKLRETRVEDWETFRVIAKKIKELSTGNFTEDNQKRLNDPDIEIPIYKAETTRGPCLVYQIDCVPEFCTDGEHQVIKVFEICTHAQPDRWFWNLAGSQLAKKGGREYIDRCTYRVKPMTKGGHKYMPPSFSAPEAIVTSLVHELPNIEEKVLGKLHEILVLEKFVAFSQALLNSILANRDVVHPFAVSSQEQEIIEHPYSCYVIGRSGTGKTTTMLLKILGLERMWHLHKESMSRPRQVFVTQSRVLATKVEENLRNMLNSLAVGAQPAKELEKLSAICAGYDHDLVDIDDEENWRGDLPKRFSELGDEHFPLIITYDKLCKLLEADFNSELQDTIPRLVDEKQTRSSKHMLSKRNSLVSYHVFLGSYWSHFPQSLTKGLDPALVFSEFLGIIKGSEQTVLNERSSLDLTTYENLTGWSQSTFARHRRRIYSLFEAYTKRRVQLGQYDATDRMQHLLAALQKQKDDFKKFHYLYVDEVQDNLLIDVLLLRMLCSNSDGLFFAGDMAQIISVRSAFKFNDLKAFMYRVEERSRAAANRVALASAMQPRSFQLLVNYRSHGGIVKCASSIIRIITELWPYAIDVLEEEHGVIDGLKPIFFHKSEDDTVHYEQFLFGDSRAPIEFGAQQCILVRDDAARDKLRTRAGDVGLIMTIPESKGLEFNDVLLYNFFEDSTVDAARWRVILNAVDPYALHNVAVPCFDEIKHAGVCMELKFLYVAVTRARKKLWVVDCSERREPMRLLWTSRNLVQIRAPSTVERLANSSTAEEWATTAKELFSNKRYMQATYAYERANMHREASVSRAYHLRDTARTTPSENQKPTNLREEAFAEAARAFTSCAKKATKDSEKLAYFKVAGSCFGEADDDASAAKAYRHAQEFTLAAQHFRYAGLFDDAVSVIQDPNARVLPAVAEKIVNVAKIHYFEMDELDKAAQLFDSEEDKLEFVEDFGFDTARAQLLESSSRVIEAAELHLIEGRPLDAIRLLTSDPDNRGALTRAATCLVQNLWSSSPFGAFSVTKEPGQMLSQFLSLSAGLNMSVIDEQQADELSMFHAFANSDKARLQQLAHKRLSPPTFVRLAKLLGLCSTPS
ncbi:P-loop containing nucleoside triphosphate hydrolase protein [Punctularia strigosozonata HHB-11173 SS5]|uniref:P-loop containing nucleoside triphosphate hydrolase protein n=1 Tax=Punctularia strigosozonata (strain HHB-11173) TaxID=741275 RepID=UPI000441665D|nr:P-loop containing nucleoside triphosphate hydrolase protein [Punctularia strigosozonata HHB-11173 SS5]EIN13313.1 P-loop containing nucleoside triphosphate hydrolase protein [Punctularia strigosozonata HHB-11173 SS5]